MSDTLLAFINRKNWLKKQSQKWAHNYTYGKSRLPTPVFLDFPWSSAGKESTCNVGDLGLIPGLGRSAGEGKGYPLQYSGLENSMDCIVHGVTKSWTRLRDFHFTYEVKWQRSMSNYKRKYYKRKWQEN